MIYALVSSYKEGRLLKATVKSAQQGCDVVCVYEGPVGPDAKADPDHGGIWNGYFGSSVATAFGVWESDAEKRTKMLQWAQQHHARFVGRNEWEEEPLWVLWLDGDETLIWGEYLADWCFRADAETGIGGFAMRIVELDGSVVKAHGRIFRGEVVSHYLDSSYQAVLQNDMIVALPNTPICAAGGVPIGWGDGSPVTIDDMGDLRPPLQGEPHILHRSMLRDPSRGVRRLHDDEQQFYGAKIEQ